MISLGGWRILDAEGNPVPGIDCVADAGTAVDRALAPTADRSR